MRLIELDGRRAGPIDRGECKDLLKVCEYMHHDTETSENFANCQDVAKIAKDLYISQSTSMHFSMMALCSKT